MITLTGRWQTVSPLRLYCGLWSRFFMKDQHGAAKRGLNCCYLQLRERVTERPTCPKVLRHVIFFNVPRNKKELHAFPIVPRNKIDKAGSSFIANCCIFIFWRAKCHWRSLWLALQKIKGKECLYSAKSEDLLPSPTVNKWLCPKPVQLKQGPIVHQHLYQRSSSYAVRPP